LSGSVSTVNRITRSWDISKTNANGASGIDLLFEWPSAQNSGITTPALYHHNGTVWQQQAASNTSSPTQTSLRFTGYTGTFSPFGIAEINSTLPVTWISFNVATENNTSVLHWQTAEEQNAKVYIIQHSTDGVNWNNIGNVQAFGFSKTVVSYRFVHSSPASGINFYRIQQVDADGRFSFSKISTVKYEPAGFSTTIMGNPVMGGTMHIQLQQPAELSLWSVDGKKLWSKKLPQGYSDVHVGHLAKGTYLLHAGTEVKKIVITN
ncbi:MAG: T9SS type A sorting domain-containing protein, partial [Chitinophagaceae bacterium]|nr:T9SS type A sorting domain-containing protein [Chitinophagaceae bacterium]